MTIVYQVLLVVAAVVPLALWLWKFRPEWFFDDELPGTAVVRAMWKSVCIGAIVAGVAIGGISAWLTQVFNENTWGYFLPVCAAVCTVVAVVSALTDSTLRLVDRWMLRIAFVEIGAALGVYLWMHGSKTDITVVATALVVTLAFFAVPAMGLSDVRSLAVGYVPLLAFNPYATAWSLGGTILMVIIFSVAKHGFKKTTFTHKVSVPFVPMLCIPAALVMTLLPVM